MFNSIILFYFNNLRRKYPSNECHPNPPFRGSVFQEKLSDILKTYEIKPFWCLILWREMTTSISLWWMAFRGILILIVCCHAHLGWTKQITASLLFSLVSLKEMICYTSHSYRETPQIRTPQIRILGKSKQVFKKIGSFKKTCKVN